MNTVEAVQELIHYALEFYSDKDPALLEESEIEIIWMLLDLKLKTDAIRQRTSLQLATRTVIREAVAQGAVEEMRANVAGEW